MATPERVNLFNIKCILFEINFLRQKITKSGERPSYKIVEGFNGRKGLSTSGVESIRASILWRAVYKQSLPTLDVILKSAIRLIDNATLTASLASSSKNCFRAFLIFRFYHGMYSNELKSVIHPKAYFACSTRFANSQHPFALHSPIRLSS